MTTSQECTVVIRYRPDAADGWPWSVTQENGQHVLTVTDLDDSSLGILLRALALASTNGAETRPVDRPADRHNAALLAGA